MMGGLPAVIAEKEPCNGPEPTLTNGCLLWPSREANKRPHFAIWDKENHNAAYKTEGNIIIESFAAQLQQRQ